MSLELKKKKTHFFLLVRSPDDINSYGAVFKYYSQQQRDSDKMSRFVKKCQINVIFVIRQLYS